MADIKFTQEEKAQIAEKVKRYFRDELDYEIGGFDAEFLIDFFSQEVGAYFYNRGLYDAQALLAQKIDDVSESILCLEKNVTFNK